MDEISKPPELSSLIEEHYALLYRYAFRLSGSRADAEDLTQQTYLTAQQKLGQLREPGHARTWLCTILRNAYLKTLRKRGDVTVRSLESAPEPYTVDKSQPVVDEERLQQALAEMPEEFRAPVILFYFEEFSYKEIAEQMDVPIGTIMSRLARAKEQLRQKLIARNIMPGRENWFVSPTKP